MKALFGEGMHPDAEALIKGALGRGVDREVAVAAVRLGRRFPMIDQSHEVWRDRLNAAYVEFETAHGHRPERGPERDLVRWNVAHELFLQNHEREPRDDAELKAFFAQVAKPPRQPVAGVDLVFTPVKSVSVLWALGDDQIRREVEQAHEAAWRRAFSYVEIHGALTRTGAAGVAQIDTHGLVAAAFDHPYSGPVTRTCIPTWPSPRRPGGSSGLWTEIPSSVVQLQLQLAKWHVRLFPIRLFR